MIILCCRSSLFSQPNDSMIPYSSFLPRIDSGKLSEHPFPFPPPFFPSLYLHTGFGNHGFATPVHRPFMDMSQLSSSSEPVHHQPCSDSRCVQCAPKVDSTEQDDQPKEEGEKISDEKCWNSPISYVQFLLRLVKMTESRWPNKDDWIEKTVNVTLDDCKCYLRRL